MWMYSSQKNKKLHHIIKDKLQSKYNLSCVYYLHLEKFSTLLTHQAAELTSLYKEYRNVMVWIVLPRPISSAKMMSVPLAQE